MIRSLPKTQSWLRPDASRWPQLLSWAAGSLCEDRLGLSHNRDRRFLWLQQPTVGHSWAPQPRWGQLREMYLRVREKSVNTRVKGGEEGAPCPSRYSHYCPWTTRAGAVENCAEEGGAERNRCALTVATEPLHSSTTGRVWSEVEPGKRRRKDVLTFVFLFPSTPSTNWIFIFIGNKWSSFSLSRIYFGSGGW